MTERISLRPIESAEFETFNQVAVQAFNDVEWPAEAVEQERRVFEFGRSIAAFDGADMVGSAAAYTFQLTVPGGAVGAAGVTFVGVLPSHRRRGILSAMMRAQLADIVARGEAVAALFASESAIYGRYGYGGASQQLRLAIRRGEGTLTPAAASLLAAPRPAGPVRLISGLPAGQLDELARVYDGARSQRPGMMARDDRWWQAVLADPAHGRRGMSAQKGLLAVDDSGPLGYALYRVRPDWGDDGLPSGFLAVQELIATDPAATAAIWSDLLNRDLIGEVAARMRPVDDPLLDMLADRRRARAQVTDGLWVRLTDVPAALCQRSYSSAVDVVIEVTDELLPGNAGRWRLQCPGPGDGGPACCERTTAAPDIALPVTALGAGYLGGTRLTGLAAAGLVSEHTKGAVTRLSAALYADPAPWCPSSF